MPSKLWDSGISPHGAASHTNSGATAGVVSSFSSGYIDATGVWTLGPYQAWNTGLTYPANQLVLGSNSRLYRAVISNAGNDPTTDGGTNWARVTIPLLGTSGKLVVSDGNEGVFVAMSGDATISSAGVVAVTKSNSNVFPAGATVLGDIWYGSAANTLSALTGQITTTKKYLTQTGSGTVSAAPAWSAVTDINGNAFPSGIAAGQVPYGSAANTILFSTAGATTQMLYFSGTTLTPTSSITSDGTYIGIGGAPNTANMLTITPAAAKIGLAIAGVSGAVPISLSAIGSYIIDATTNQAAAMRLVSTVAVGGSSGAALDLGANGGTPANGTVLGASRFGSYLAGNYITGAQVSSQAMETWVDASSHGSHLIFWTKAATTTTLSANMFVHADGDIWLNGQASALATNATKRFPWKHSMAGIPTGTPANTRTGSVPFVSDTTNQTDWTRYGSNWYNTGGGTVISNVAATGSIAATTDYCAVDTSGGAVTMTLPDAATRGNRDLKIRNKTGGANNVTVARAGSDTINSGTTSITLTVGQCIQLIANGTDWQSIGNKAATGATVP